MKLLLFTIGGASIAFLASFLGLVYTDLCLEVRARAEDLQIRSQGQYFVLMLLPLMVFLGGIHGAILSIFDPKTGWFVVTCLTALGIASSGFYLHLAIIDGYSSINDIGISGYESFVLTSMLPFMSAIILGGWLICRRNKKIISMQ